MLRILWFLFNLFLTGLLHLKENLSNAVCRQVVGKAEGKEVLYSFRTISLMTVFSSYCSGKEFVSYEISKSQQFYPPTK